MKTIIYPLMAAILTSLMFSTATKAQDDEVFNVVEKQPQFPGGEPARMQYLQQNLNYPKKAREAGIQGTVFITFVVEKDGSLSNVRILRGIGGGCDEECLRVVRDMPDWEPGKQDGETVRVQFNMPVKFKLAGSEKSSWEKFWDSILGRDG